MQSYLKNSSWMQSWLWSKTVTQVRQAEAVKLQQPLVRGETHESAAVGVISYKGKDNSRVVPGNTGRSTRRKQTSHNTDRKPCSRCGKKSSHEYHSCPARNAICRQCHKRGHYQTVCWTGKSGKVQQVVKEESSNEYFLGTVEEKEPGERWAITLIVNNIPVDSLIDTGTEVTLISQSIHRALGRPPLQVTSRNLKGPSNDRLPVKGWFHGKVQKKNLKSKKSNLSETGCR